MADFASSSVKPFTILTEDDGVLGLKIEQDPEKYTAEQLKLWLKCRGIKQSGKRGEIVQLVTDCLKEPNHSILNVGIDGGKWLAAKVIKENEELSRKESIQDKVIIPVVLDGVVFHHRIFLFCSTMDTLLCSRVKNNCSSRSFPEMCR